MNETADYIYIHVPFCPTRCSYCAFNSSVYDEEISDRYISALREEILLRCGSFSASSIYIGGGTPTCLQEKQLARMMDMLGEFSHDIPQEFTIEANPTTINMNKLMTLRKAGVNRVSLGVQTFNPEGLELLGRSHSAKQARMAVAMLQEAGFERISLDFIYAWPGQTEYIWGDDLQKALKLGVDHISCYSLTYEPDTLLTEWSELGKLDVCDEDLERSLFDMTGEILDEAGLRRYEISNFAKPGFESRHNINYWTGGEYLGFGAGAHSHFDGVRSSNVESILDYIECIESGEMPDDFDESLEDDESARECGVMWLRLREGIDLAAFFERTGFTAEKAFGKDLSRMLEMGWLEKSDTHIWISDEMLPLADTVLSELI